MTIAVRAADEGVPPKVTPMSKLPVTRELPDPFKMAKRAADQEQGGLAATAGGKS